MKKIVLLFVVLAFLLTAANPPLAGVQLQNKGAVEVYVQFTSLSAVYVLSVPPGTRALPAWAAYTIPAGEYDVTFTYADGACEAPGFNYFVHGAINRFTVLPCNELPAQLGEPRLWKVVSVPF